MYKMIHQVVGSRKPSIKSTRRDRQIYGLTENSGNHEITRIYGTICIVNRKGKTLKHCKKI